MDFYNKDDLLLQIGYHGVGDKIINYSFILKLIFGMYNGIFLLVGFFVFLLLDVGSIALYIFFFVLFSSNAVIFLLLMIYIGFSKNKIYFYKQGIVVENMFSPSGGIVFSYQNIETDINNSTFEIHFHGFISYNYKIKNLQAHELEQIQNLKNSLHFN